MRIGKVKRTITRPDLIPVKIPKPQKKPFKVDNWPTKQPLKVPPAPNPR